MSITEGLLIWKYQIYILQKFRDNVSNQEEEPFYKVYVFGAPGN